MKRIRHSPEQIIRKLREADTELASGKTIAEVCKGLGVAETTYHRWRNQYCGMKADESSGPGWIRPSTAPRPAGTSSPSPPPPWA